MSERKIATAAPYAAMLAPPSTKLLQAYRNPGTSPNAALKYTYSPPASGSSAPSSAKHRAPSMATTPAATHAASTSAGVPTAWAMAADLRNTPVPMVMPTTREAAWVSVRSRRSSSTVELTPLSYNPAGVHTEVKRWQSTNTGPRSTGRAAPRSSPTSVTAAATPGASTPQVVQVPLSVEAAVD